MATANTSQAWRLGTVGRALPGYELRCADDGELLIRSEGVFQGYLNLPEETRRTLDSDGWLHTGDIGVIDEEGWGVLLSITDGHVTTHELKTLKRRQQLQKTRACSTYCARPSG